MRVPDGMIAVKPMPKPGWKIDTVSGSMPQTYSHFHGAKLTEGVTEVSFTGGNLPDAYYDEFVITGFLAGDLEAGKLLYFPVVQECERASTRWIEIPAAANQSRRLSRAGAGAEAAAENVTSAGHDGPQLEAELSIGIVALLIALALAGRRVRACLAGEGVACGRRGAAAARRRC